MYIGADRACAAGMEALNDPNIQLVSMITEGVPEKDAKLLARHALKLGKTFNGPSSIGIVSAGSCRLGVIGGAFDNLVACKLYREGSFGVITKSGGLSNEIIWICSQFADGITRRSALAAMPTRGPDYVSYLEKFEHDPQTKAVVIVGEMGGDLEERAAEWYGAKKRRIKLWPSCQGSARKACRRDEVRTRRRQGRHERRGSARSKSDALKKAGANVPDTFGALGPVIKQTYEDFVKSGEVRPIPDLSPADVPKLPKTVEEGMKTGEVMVAPWSRRRSATTGATSLSTTATASELINKGYEIPHVIGLLWDKRLISKQEAGYQTNHDAVCGPWPWCQRRPGDDHRRLRGHRDVAIGRRRLIMIGPRFGGAVTDAGRYFKHAIDNKMSVDDFLVYMKKPSVLCRASATA